MKIIKQEYVINASLENVWDALVNPKIIEKWGAGQAKMSAKEGFEFKLWGGDIHGKNIKVIPQKKLVQEWYGGKWNKPSILTITLTQNNNGTKVNLIHEDVPDNEYKDIENGWKDYYMGPLKKLLEDK